MNWREQYFDKITCKGTIINSGNGNLIVKGEVKSNRPDPTILYWAGNPPIEELDIQDHLCHTKILSKHTTEVRI